MAAQGNGLTEEDMQRPADEGRSLHDELCEFFRAKMGLSTPITRNNMPKASSIMQAFKSITKDEHRFQQLLLDLQATRFHALWPEHNVVPPTKEGLAWYAAHCIAPLPERTMRTRSMDKVEDSKEEEEEGEEEDEEEEEEEEDEEEDGDKDNDDDDNEEDDDDEDNKDEAAEEEEPTICEVCEACPCEWIEYGKDIVNHAKESFPLLPKKYNKNEVNPKIRYTCYMFYTYAKYGNLGRGNRMKPSKCVEDNIFKLWPSDKRTGFQYSKKQLAEDDDNDSNGGGKRPSKRRKKAK